jgi:hypothetical protein
VFTTCQPFRGERVAVKYDRHGNGTLEEAVFNFEYKPLKDGAGNCTGILIHAVEVGG